MKSVVFDGAGIYLYFVLLSNQAIKLDWKPKDRSGN